MPTATMKLEGDAEMIGILRLLDAQTKDFQELARYSRAIISRSIDKNFKEGGRPEKWPSRWEAMEKIFPNLKGKGTLTVSGALRRAVVQNPTVRLLKDGIEYLSDFEYAAKQNDGGPSEVKVPDNKVRHTKATNKGKFGPKAPYVILIGPQGYYAKKLDSNNSFTINVRPRPFFMLQDEDVNRINKRFLDKVVEIMEAKTKDLKYADRD